MEKQNRSVFRACARDKDCWQISFRSAQTPLLQSQQVDLFSIWRAVGKGRCHAGVNCFIHLETFRFYIESEL